MPTKQNRRQPHPLKAGQDTGPSSEGNHWATVEATATGPCQRVAHKLAHKVLGSTTAHLFHRGGQEAAAGLDHVLTQLLLPGNNSAHKQRPQPPRQLHVKETAL